MNFGKHWAASLDDYVIDLAWSHDGSLLAAASAAGGVTLFDAATGAVKHRLAGHADGANCLAWCPTTLELASGGQDGCVKFWSATTGEQLAETKLGTAWVEHLAWVARSPAGPENSSHLVAAAGKKLVALHGDGTTAHEFLPAPKTISALAVQKSGAQFAAAHFGGVSVWNTADFSAAKEFTYGNAIHALVWSPDGHWLVAGCQDNAVHLWSPAEDQELHMSGYETKLKELSFSHDSRWLATGGGRDSCVWDCSGAGPEGREPLLLPHSAKVAAVAFQHQHGFLASGGADGEFSLWAPDRKNPLFAEVKMPTAATKFAWRADDTLLAVGTEKGQLFVFRTA